MLTFKTTVGTDAIPAANDNQELRSRFVAPNCCKRLDYVEPAAGIEPATF